MRPFQGMSPENNHRPAMLSWLFVIALLALSTVLAVLQYRWIGEVSRADRERLHTSLQAGPRPPGLGFTSSNHPPLARLLHLNFSHPPAKPADRRATEDP